MNTSIISKCDGCGEEFFLRDISNYVKLVHDSITSPNGSVSNYQYLIGRDFCEECAKKNLDFRKWNG